MASKDTKARPSKTKTPFFKAFFQQLLDPNVSVSDRITEFFAAALGKKGWSTSPITPGNHPDYFRQNGEA